MGADLFGSFAESTCAALVIAAAAVEGSKHTLSAAGWETWLAMDFLLLLGFVGYCRSLQQWITMGKGRMDDCG